MSSEPLLSHKLYNLNKRAILSPLDHFEKQGKHVLTKPLAAWISMPLGVRRQRAYMDVFTACFVRTCFPCLVTIICISH